MWLHVLHSKPQTEDGRNVRGPAAHPARGEEYARQNNDNDEHRFVWPRRTQVEVDNMVQDAFARVNTLHESVAGNDRDAPNMPEDPVQETTDVNMADMEQLLLESTEAVYEGCSINRLQAGIVMLNMANLYGVPHTFMDELLSFLSTVLLPQSNCLPRNTYEMKKMIMKMGLEHEAIDCCPHGHILYEGVEHKDLLQCPKCGISRYLSGSTNIPRKVLRYFPIINHFQRLFRCPEVVELLKWHANNRSEDGQMRSVVDSPQWAAVGVIDPEFKIEDRNLYLGLVADGVNSYGNQSTKYSMWPVLLVIYNLPPWLVTKFFFVSLAILIPGEKAPNGEAFDVFIAPLVRDLVRLWTGIQTVDASEQGAPSVFLLRAILLWTINDFPAYGLISGQQTKGYRGCPVCVAGTCASHSRALKKMVYLGSRRWLAPGHRFRRARIAFNGNQEFREAPIRPSGEDVLRMGEERAQYLAQGGRPDGENDPVKLHGVKRVSSLYQLPYWSVSLLLPMSFNKFVIDTFAGVVSIFAHTCML